jgi:hypothetical protein
MKLTAAIPHSAASIVMPDPVAQARLDAFALDNGQLQVVHADFYRQFPQEQLSVFGHRHAAYVLPTWELITKLDELIKEVSPSRSAIEIGAGNGLLGMALGIPCTDSHMQTRPEIQELYATMGQPLVTYGEHVQKLDALEAVEHCRPEVVVAAWVTHLYNVNESHRGGNMWGVDEVLLLSKIKRYIFVGNAGPHALKPLHSLPSTGIHVDGLFSRGANANGNAIWVWDNPDYAP